MRALCFDGESTDDVRSEATREFCERRSHEVPRSFTSSSTKTKDLARTIPAVTQAIVSNYNLFQEMTFTSASCAWVVSMQALEGFALASHILIVLSTEHDANT